jgi:hypothetical protein
MAHKCAICGSALGHVVFSGSLFTHAIGRECLRALQQERDEARKAIVRWCDVTALYGGHRACESLREVGGRLQQEMGGEE